jgi:hypothetical protein
MAEAASTAQHLSSTESSRQPAFGEAGLTLYQVSIAQVLGDSGTAIDHARSIRPADIPPGPCRITGLTPHPCPRNRVWG